MKIYVKNNDINRALRVLKKKMVQEGDIKELRARNHFVSKGEKKRLAEKAGRKRWLKKQVQLEKQREKAEYFAMKQRKKQSQQRKKQFTSSNSSKTK